MPDIINKIKDELQSIKDLNPIVKTYVNSLLDLNNIIDKDTRKIFNWLVSNVGVPDNILFDNNLTLPSIKRYTDCVVLKIYNKYYKIKALYAFDLEGKQKFKITKTKIIPFEQASDNLFFKGLAIVKVKVSKGVKKFGIIDDNGNYVVKPDYDFISNVLLESNNSLFALCNINVKTGFIDIAGFNVRLYDIDNEETLMSYSNKQCFKVKINEKFGYINASGDEVLPVIYDEIKRTLFLFRVNINNKYGIVDLDFKIIVQPQYVDIDIIFDQYQAHNQIVYAVLKKTNNKFTIYDDKRNIIHDFDWDSCFASKMSDFVGFIKDGNKGLFSLKKNRSFNLDQDVNLSEIDSLSGYGTYFSVSSEKNGKFALADKNFNLITDFIFNHPLNFNPFNQFTVYLSKDNRELAINRLEYPEHVFLKLFGIKSEFNFLNSAQQRFPEINPKSDDFNFVYVAGTSYQDKQKIIESVNKKDIIFLIPEPDNKYDLNAIALYKKTNDDSIKIGYIPANLNQAVLKEIIEGKKLFGIVYSIIKDHAYPEIVIEIIEESSSD